MITSSTSKYGFLLQNRTWGPTKPPVLTQIINLNLTGCNTWTKLLKKDKNGLINVNQREAKWEQKLGTIYGPKFWDRCYLNCRNLYFNNKFKWFYYQIVRGVLKTNQIISKFIPGVRPECTFCNTQLETIEHLFYSCTIVKAFYREVQDIIQVETPIFQFQITLIHTLFGTKGQIDSATNIFLLVLKYYIWTTRCKEQQLSTRGFLNYLKTEMRMLYYTYYRGGKMQFINNLLPCNNNPDNDNI